MNPAEDIVDLLDRLGIMTKLKNAFTGVLRPESEFIPANVVFALPSGGIASTRIHSDRSELRYPDVQLHLRWHDFITGYSKANEIHNALEGAQIPGYYTVRNKNSQPVFLKEDENSNYHWSINVTLKYHT